MSDITLINDSEQSSLVTNGLAKNGEMYLKKAGSTDAGSIVVYDSGVWKTFAHEGGAFTNGFSASMADPTDDHGSADLTGTNVMSGDFTLSVWYKAPQQASYESILTNNYGTGQEGWGWMRTDFNGAVNGIAIYQSEPGQSNSYMSGFGYPGVTTSFQNNAWNHIMMSRTSTTLTLYVNGSSVGSATTSLDFGVASLITAGQYRPDGGTFFDELAIWDSDQSSNITQIRDTSGANPVPGNLASMSTKPVYWWRMGDDDSIGATSITNNSQATGGTLSLSLNNGAAVSTDVPS